jgi:UDP:flavonoid glycosyltransferase YjiC (YdhE family)
MPRVFTMPLTGWPRAIDRREDVSVNVLLCPMSDPGYLYPAIAVGRELQRRKETVRVLGRAAAASTVAEAGLQFLTADDHGEKGGFSVARWSASGLAQYRAVLRAAAEVRPDVLVTSVLCHGALLAAEVLDLPVVVLGLAAHLWDYVAGGSEEPQPPSSPRWWRTRETLQQYERLRERAGLPARKAAWPDSPLFGDALLLQGDPVLEHPGAVLPARVCHVGPCAWEPQPDQADVDVIMAHLDRIAKPVVYVHLGRTFGGTSLWPRLNAAFTGGPFQAVVEQGRSDFFPPAPGADILLVRRAWMGPLIARAGLVLTSGTSAPVLAGLLHGRPLAVAPAGSEQPLVAAACVRAGVAIRVPPEVRADPSAELRLAWHDSGVRARARQLGGLLARAGGAWRAADIVARAGAATRSPSGVAVAAAGFGAPIPPSNRR